MQVIATKNKINAKQLATQRCIYCSVKTLSVAVTVNGKVSIARVNCSACGHEVAVALLADGGKVAKCPKCHAVATVAFGKRSDASRFVAFACSRCSWVASDAFMIVAAKAFELLEH